uniref:Uncharacterized protein MANES_09G067200 n=1 Tax=Rhizophora mucronata TaxID=61149 RepID=A0A2P2LZH9_RHIMU
MNKLLGPGLYLDAKNSKDTNAAMLRWWSLLEKYSCKASKLHLKPRRFKIFIEALENQLLKDRKKNIRKRPLQGENGSSTAASTVMNQNRASGQDTRTLKLILVDGQNIQKLGTGRGTLKHNINIGVISGNNKGDSTVVKPARRRRKPGAISSTAYKKWERAAIAGVSLVADAAEHLERAAIDKEAEHVQGISAQKVPDPIEKVISPLDASFQYSSVCSNVHTSMKLKLQLFPIDDGTRRALELDKHNPHLELTLGSRKKISSVLEHLNQKWGDSSVASEELMLLPYNAHRENLVGCQRWMQDSNATAADVHISIGSPAMFRLRYGWFLNTEFTSMRAQKPLVPTCTSVGDSSTGNRMQEIVDPISSYGSSTNDQAEKIVDPCNDQLTAANKICASASAGGHNSAVTRNNLLEFSDPAANTSWHRKEISNRANPKQPADFDYLRPSNGIALPAGEWADSPTNISVGDLLAEVPHDENQDCSDAPIVQSNQCLQMPFSCDSFDAAIAAHMSKHQKFLSTVVPHTGSIWDAEETCDAFSFQKSHLLYQEVPTSSCVGSPSTCKQMQGTNSKPSNAFVEELPDAEDLVERPDVEPINECQSNAQIADDSARDFSGLADIYWPDSLGPLDLDIPSSKYHSDLILSDSLGGLNRLIASSLDTFQNCSFFGLDKKDPTSTVETQETISFSGFKIGSGI